MPCRGGDSTCARCTGRRRRLRCGASYLPAGVVDLDPEHARELAGERVDLGPVADRGDQLGRLTERVDPAVGAVEVVAVHDVAEHEAVERHPSRDELAHGGVTLLQPQVARVEPVRLDRDVGLGDELLVTAERAQRRLLTGLVAVEGEDHLAPELLVVVQQPAYDAGVVVAERRAAGRDRGHHARQVARHHVGVALDHHGLRGARDVAAGEVDAVEHLALLVDRRLGSVEVLRLDPVVVEDPSGAEADGVAAACRGSATSGGRGTGRSARAPARPGRTRPAPRHRTSAP